MAPFEAAPADRLDDPVKVAPGAVASWLPVAVPADIVLLPDNVTPGAVASPDTPPVAVPAEIDEVPVSVTPGAVALTAPTTTVAVSLPINTLSASTL